MASKRIVIAGIAVGAGLLWYWLRSKRTQAAVKDVEEPAPVPSAKPASTCTASKRKVPLTITLHADQIAYLETVMAVGASVPRC